MRGGHGAPSSDSPAPSGTAPYIRSVAGASRGLPRGRSSLPPGQVRIAQRDRLLRAITAAVAERGYADVTVADVVEAARVSRTSFYAQFADREDCVLAAAVDGQRALFGHISSAVENQSPDTDDVVVLRAGLRAYLGFLADRPDVATLLFRDLASVGRRGTEQLAQGRRKLTARTAVWHARARARHPDWPAVPAEVYRALTGATEELIRDPVRTGAVDELRSLEDVIVDLHVRLLTA